MSNPFSPYQTWLGLRESLSRPNHFELLGLDESEDDTKTISAAADRAASRVRRCRPGEHTAVWAAVLDQIAEAKLCLIDPEKRAQYRTTLREPTEEVRTGGPMHSRLEPTPRGSDRPPTAADPNMYPPGIPETIARPTTPIGERPAATDFAFATDSPPDIPSAPMAAFPTQAPPTLPMSPLDELERTPHELISHPDPMRPFAAPTLSADPYAPLPAMPGSSAMAPLPLDYGSAMAAVSVGGIAAAGVPDVGIPVAGIPVAEHPMASIPMAPMPMAVPMAHAEAYSAGTSEALSPPLSFATPASAVPPSPPAVNRTSAALLAARHERSRSLGPILFGVGTTLVLLVIVGGVMRRNASEQDAARLADASPSADGSNSLQSGDGDSSAPNSSASNASATAPIAFEDQRPIADLPTDSASSAPPTRLNPQLKTAGNRSLQSEMEKKPMEVPLAAGGKSAAVEPAMASAKTAEPRPGMKPEPAASPVTDTPSMKDELPKPSQAELVKLGRAMQKAREAIGEHDFDKADAFLEVASDMPRLPEHQAMLDRLKLLSESVKDYRAAIQTSIGKLASGSSFEVGEQVVGVVETSPEKVILRVAGQNRTYTLRDMPVGLAAALAAQTLAPDDPNTLTLKGAYVMASPRAKPEDVKKAREFLEKASGSVEAAAELLRLSEDQYTFAAAADK